MNPKTFLATLALPLALFAPGAPAAQEAPPRERSLERVPSVAEFADEWARELRSLDLAERRAAWDEVVDAAARSPAVRDRVEAWTHGDDVELAWTAELLLREIDGRAARPRRPGGPFGARPDAPFRGFGLDHGDLFQQLDEMFETPFRGFVPHEPFRFDLFGPGGPGGPGGFGGAPGTHSTSEGLSLQIGPDGVRVEVRETVDGEERVKTYEAESLEALFEEHPELKDRIGSRGPSWGTPFGGDDAQGFRGLLRRPFAGAGEPPISLAPSEVRTDVLNVRVLSPEARTRRVEGLADDVGLEVVQVIPGGLADHLGVGPGDVLVELDGRTIRSPADVKQALAERAADATIELRVVTRGGDRQTRRWTPPADDAQEANAAEGEVF